MDRYKTPARRATATIVEKKSEFIAALAPAATEDEALAFLGEVRAAHRTANHNVYAYELAQGARARFSDDGEPAKTAGLPVLTVLRGAGLANCVLVVTRYFGGTKLGTGGLVRAYTAAASAAIQAAGKTTIRSLVKIGVTLPYPQYEAARRITEQACARIPEEPTFTDTVHLTAVLPAEEGPALQAALQELLRGGESITASKPFDANW